MRKVTSDGMTTRGHLRVTEYNLLSGVETITLDERNMIIDSGVALLPRALNPKVSVNNRLGVIKFGKDVGNGTEQQPEQPTKEMGSNIQDVVFAVPIENMHYSTTATTITLSVSMAGEDVVGNNDYLKYTSAAIYSDNGTLFAYKRFPFRMFNRWVRVKVEWTISTVRDDGNGGGEVCPVPPQVVGVVLDAPTQSVDVGGTITMRGYERFDNGALTVVPNGSKWTSNNSNVSFSSGVNGNVIITGSQAGTSIVQLISGAYSDSRIVRIIEKIDFVELLISDNRSPSNTGIGGEILYNVDINRGGVKTRVTQSSTWVFSDNVQVLSTTSDGVLIRILSAGRVSVDVTYLEYAANTGFDVAVPPQVSGIEIIPLTATRFNVGETLDFTATVYYTNGDSRLATINDRWVYNGLAISLTEIGIVGNLRITAKYLGDYDIRVYIEGVEGRLNFKIAPPITTVSVYGYPQTPIHVIPDILNSAMVKGVQNEAGEEDITIDAFYMTASSPNLTMVDGIKVVGSGNHTITVNKDSVVGAVIGVSSTYLTSAPMVVTVGTGGIIEFIIDSPTSDGVYIDHNDLNRRYYGETSTVSIPCSTGDMLKIYGGCTKLTINGDIDTIATWGEFSCGGYNISSPVLRSVPYVAPSVTSMDSMFAGCILFNQNLSGWCVTNFPTLPSNFDAGCVSWNEAKPIWGTCPNVNEIYKVVTTFPSGTNVNVGETIPLTITGISRIDQVVPFDPSEFTLVYDNSKIFLTQTGETHVLEGLQRGVTSLTVNTSHGTTTATVEVK